MLLVFMCLHTSTNQYFAKVHAFAYIRILCKSWHSNRYCNWRGCLCSKTGLIFNVSACIAKRGSRPWLGGVAPHSQSRKPHGLGLVARQQQLPALAAAGWCRWVRPAAGAPRPRRSRARTPRRNFQDQELAQLLSRCQQLVAKINAMYEHYEVPAEP